MNWKKKKNLEHTVRNAEYFLFDMDGVLRIGDKQIYGADKLIQRLTNLGKKGMIITNECRGGPHEIRKQLLNMDINLPDSWEIYTSSLDCYYYLEKLNLTNKIKSKWCAFGDIKFISYIKDKTSHFKGMIYSENEIDILVIGAMNNRQWQEFGKRKLENILKKNKNVKIICTCNDISDPSNNVISPLFMIDSMKIKVNITYICGKPNKDIFLRIKEILSIKAEDKLLFIGDNIDTDIEFANKCNIPCILVRSGIDIPENRKKIDYICNSVLDIYNAIFLL